MQRTIFEDEHWNFRDSVHRFLVHEAVPNTEAWESSGMVDRGFWRKAAEHGFVAFEAPEECGGLGIDDFRFNAVINEEIAYTGAVGDNFSLQNDIIVPYLLELTDDEQKQRWLPALASGESVFAIAMTEPGAGSDLRAMKASAKREWSETKAHYSAATAQRLSSGARGAHGLSSRRSIRSGSTARRACR